MSKHEECASVGKFDCRADEKIHEFTLDSGMGEGNVEGPAAWFEPLDLDIECEGHSHDPSIPSSVAGEAMYCDGSCRPEWALADHYGTRWIIAREDSQGRFWVECYDTEDSRDERVEGLRSAHAEWDMGVL